MDGVMARGPIRFWWRWLLIVSVAVLLFGLTLVIVPDLPLWLFNLLLFSSSKTSVLYAHNAAGYIKEAHAVLGAVMVGCSISLLSVLVGPFRRGERGAWYAVSLSILAWYVLDTGFSLHAGYEGNVLLNTVFLLMFAVPLVGAYRTFNPAP